MTAQTQNRFSSQKGFTLIELLVVIGILAILLAITLIAINPARQFGNANNTARRSHVTQILNAIGAYQAENRGQLPADIIGLADGVGETLNDTNFPTLCTDLVPDYIPALPTNPTLNTAEIDEAACAAAFATGYTIMRDANNRITITADTTDNAEVIFVTR